MGLVVELRDIEGRVLGKTGEGGALLPPYDDDAFPTIRYIDAYGDTYFNGLQMKAVIPEFKALAARARSPGQRKLLDEIIALATECQARPHRFLVFLGD